MNPRRSIRHSLLRFLVTGFLFACSLANKIPQTSTALPPSPVPRIPKGQVAQADQPPAVPSAISPADGTVLNAKPQLCWKNNGDPNGKTVETSAEVWGAGTWTSPWLSGDSPCWTPPDAMSGEYSWSIKARNDKGVESKESMSWTFQILSGLPTNSPEVDVTDPVAIAAWFKRTTRAGDASAFEYFVPEQPEYQAPVPPSAYTQFTCEALGPWCRMPRSDFMAGVRSRIGGVNSCSYWSAEAAVGTKDLGYRVMRMWIRGWSPQWPTAIGSTDLLQLDFEDKDSRTGSFALSVIGVGVDTSADFVSKECP